MVDTIIIRIGACKAGKMRNEVILLVLSVALLALVGKLQRKSSLLRNAQI